MAHPEQKEFCERISKKFLEYFKNVKVLDAGSLDINGNNRQFFQDCHYVGVDVRAGKNVDVVCKIHQMPIMAAESFDTIISTEMLEHDETWIESINAMIWMLKKGGLLVMTCATIGRKPHCVGREVGIEWGNYYKNLTVEDIKTAIDIDGNFKQYGFETNETSNDLYFWGLKS